MNQITTRRTIGEVVASTSPPVISARLANNLAVARNGLFGSELLASNAVSDDERRELADHVRALRAYIAPGDRREIAQTMSRIFLALTPRSDDADGARARIAAYVDVLSPLPVWAVAKAVGEYLNGSAGDGKWCPTAVELYKRAAGHVAPFIDKIGRIDEVLRAKVVETLTPPKEAREATVRAVRQQWGLGEIAANVSRGTIVGGRE